MSKATQRTHVRGPWLAFALRWVSWAAVGVALVLVAGFVELSEELLDREEQSTRLLDADAAVLRLFARLRTPWLNVTAARRRVLAEWRAEEQARVRGRCSLSST
jgi:hypothetical protein